MKPSQAQRVAELEDQYAECLASVKEACKDNLPRDIRSQRAETLKAINRELRKAKCAVSEWMDKPEWTTYPAQEAVPRCPEDGRFAQSFGIDEGIAAKAFFDEYGFVVFRDVLSSAECAKTVDEIWDYLEHRTPGLRRSDSDSWSLMSSEYYGLPAAHAIFTPQVVSNRQSKRVYAALDAILPKSPEPDIGQPHGPHPSVNSVVVSHDRWCVYRPSAGRPEWRTSENLHLDVNPWAYCGVESSEGLQGLRYGSERSRTEGDAMLDFRTELNAVKAPGPHHQGLLNLLDNFDEDGGTRVVPKFHRSFPSWLEALGPSENNVAQSSVHDSWLVRGPLGGGRFKFSNEDPIHKLAHRVPMRAGSMLLWNHCVAHGSKANSSGNFRMAQFLRGFRACELSVEQSLARAALVHAYIKEDGAPLLLLSPSVFGASPIAEPDGSTGDAEG